MCCLNNVLSCSIAWYLGWKLEQNNSILNRLLIYKQIFSLNTASLHVVWTCFKRARCRFSWLLMRLTSHCTFQGRVKECLNMSPTFVNSALALFKSLKLIEFSQCQHCCVLFAGDREEWSVLRNHNGSSGAQDKGHSKHSGSQVECINAVHYQRSAWRCALHYSLWSWSLYTQRSVSIYCLHCLLNMSCVNSNCTWQIKLTT